jgi:hypothetical protein
MWPCFDEPKTTQAAAKFLRLAGGHCNYMVLIKFLYLLDREGLLSWSRPVTFDEYYSMKLGPVLSRVHNLITEMHLPEERSYWAEHISAPSNYEVALTQEAGDDLLSEAEEEAINNIFQRYGSWKNNPFGFADFLHKVLPEWKEVTSGRFPLSIADILTAGNKTAEEIRMVEAELQAVSSVTEFLSPSRCE